MRRSSRPRPALDLIADLTSGALWITLTVLRTWAPIGALAMIPAVELAAQAGEALKRDAPASARHRTCWVIVGKSERGFILMPVGSVAPPPLGWCERQPAQQHEK